MTSRTHSSRALASPVSQDAPAVHRDSTASATNSRASSTRTASLPSGLSWKNEGYAQGAPWPGQGAYCASPVVTGMAVTWADRNPHATVPSSTEPHSQAPVSCRTIRRASGGQRGRRATTAPPCGRELRPPVSPWRGLRYECAGGDERRGGRIRARPRRTALGLGRHPAAVLLG